MKPEKVIEASWSLVISVSDPISLKATPNKRDLYKKISELSDTALKLRLRLPQFQTLGNFPADFSTGYVSPVSVASSTFSGQKEIGAKTSESRKCFIACNAQWCGLKLPE